MFRAALDLSDEDKEFVSYVNSDNFPVFYQDSVEGYKCFTHTLMKRHKLGLPIRGEVNSNACEAAEILFMNFCFQQNIEVNNIIRAAVNFNTYEGEGYLPPHVDHEFPHKVFIAYLNEFSNGHTYLFDKNMNIEYDVDPKCYDAIVFDGQKMHSAGSCLPGEVRVVLVVTFN